MPQFLGDTVTVTNTLFPNGEMGVVQGVDDTSGVSIYRVSVPSLGLVIASEDELTAVAPTVPVDAVVDPAPYSPTVITLDPPEVSA